MDPGAAISLPLPRGSAMGPVPLISFVTCSRNDDYVDGMLDRQQAALDFLAEQLNAFEIPAEIVFVDWNGPPDRPGLSRALRWPAPGRYVSSRVIVVENEIHRRFRHADHLGMNAALGLNVGIRRADGRFILAKSADTFYSDDVVRYLGSANLSGGSMYRCDRCDIPPALLGAAGEGRNPFFRACAASVSKRYRRPTVPGGYGIPALHTDASGDFLLMAREDWWRIGGFKEWDSAVGLDVDGLAMHAAHALGVREIELPDTCVVYKPLHSSISGKRRKRNFVHPSAFVCGLMELLRLPAVWRIAVRAAVDYPRRSIDGVPGASFPSYALNFLEPARKLAREGQSAIEYSPDWGLEKETLEEISTCEAVWQRGRPGQHAGEGAGE